jgi:intracellular sulfur oxidation DsrE/DsrF family protein
MKKILTLLFVGLITFFTTLNAKETVEAKIHKVVIQVSTDDLRTQKIALNNAVNLQKLYGLDNVEIEIVAFGPGLGLLTDKSKQNKRVESLALQNIAFSACSNSIKKVEKKSGSKVVLLEGVQSVTAGVARIIELQEDGYSYIRP